MHRLTILLIVFGAAAARNIDNRISGGHDAKIEDYPYQVSLQSTTNVHFCGGAIIKPDRILTAAHCLVFASASRMQVRVGSTSRKAGGTLHSVKSLVNHPQFNGSTVDYDVAVVVLKEPIVFTHLASPIRLVSSKDGPPKAGEMLTVSGWGLAQPQVYEFAIILQAATIAAVDQAQCKKVYEGKHTIATITPQMFCAGGDSKGTRTLQGDSGGPVVNKKKQLVGVVSWGRNDAKPGWPGVYTDLTVASIQSFIADNLK